jgi:hypothetical protein
MEELSPDLLSEERLSEAEIQLLAKKVDETYRAAENAWISDGRPTQLVDGKLVRMVTEPVREQLVKVAYLKMSLRQAIEARLEAFVPLENKLQLLELYR